MDKRIMAWEDLEVGDTYYKEYVVTPDLVAEYIAANGDDHPWYTGPSPFGGPIAPFMLIAARHAGLVSIKYVITGQVNTQHATQFFHPAMVGSLIRVYGRLADKFEKRARRYFAIEVESVDENGVLVARDRRVSLVRYRQVGEEVRSHE